MNPSQRALIGLLAIAAGLWPSSALAAPQADAKATATIRRVTVLGTGKDVEVEISGSQSLTPEAQVVTGPDRLVIDFANAVPGSELRNLSLSRGEMKGVRVGLYKSDPPVTRVVLDLKTAQPYQLFPSGNTVIVKLSSTGKVAPLPMQPVTVRNIQARPVQPIKPAARFEVEFQNGSLSIWADKATLAEVLYEVHKRTGADIPIPAGAEQEQVVAKLGPAPAREVLAALLNGSRFNFIMVGSDRDPSQLRSVLLSVRGGAMPETAVYSAPPPSTAQAMPEAMPQPAEAPTPQPPPEQAEPDDSPR
jgi:hypothetical protein